LIHFYKRAATLLIMTGVPMYRLRNLHTRGEYWRE